MTGYRMPHRKIYVQPGECRLTSQPAVLCTVLGSCVGITFLVPRLGVGVLCHPMMPQCHAAQWDRLSVAAGRRYVDFAVRNIAGKLDLLGAVRAEVVVKVFGGNDVLISCSGASARTIGRLNGESALRVLGEEGFLVAVSCLGGAAGVHIAFETTTDDVLLRRLESGLRDRAVQAARTVRCPLGADRS